MRATIRRDGAEFEQEFARGIATTKIKKLGETRKRGTRIHFRPDPEIFGKRAKFDPAIVRETLEVKSYLHKGLEITFVDHSSGQKEVFKHPNGIADYLKRIVAEKGKPVVHPEPFVYEREDDPRLEVALQWTEGTEEVLRSYANGIPTGSGGTHEAGLKQALTKAIRAYMEQHKLLPKGLRITAEDVREGLFAIISVFVPEPQFQGQTKDRLNNPEIAAPVENAVRSALELYLNQNQSIAEAIVARIIISARAREASRAASQQVSRKTAVSHRLNLPGKLNDCSSTDPAVSELFLVEGDSAGGNAKMGAIAVSKRSFPSAVRC